MLPPWLLQASMLLPITHALKGLRATLLSGASLADVGGSLVVLVAFAGIGFSLALAAFGLTVRRVKQTGTMDQH